MKHKIIVCAIVIASYILTCSCTMGKSGTSPETPPATGRTEYYNTPEMTESPPNNVQAVSNEVTVLNTKTVDDLIVSFMDVEEWPLGYVYGYDGDKVTCDYKKWMTTGDINPNGFGIMPLETETLKISKECEIWVLYPEGSSTEFAQISNEDFFNKWQEDYQHLMHMYIDNGVILKMAEQYVP